jgi:hypothetical protein
MSLTAGINTRRLGRASEIAREVEAQDALDSSLAAEGEPTLGASPQPQKGVAELSHREAGIDSKGLRDNIDRPPVAGVNRKFMKRGV